MRGATELVTSQVLYPAFIYLKKNKKHHKVSDIILAIYLYIADHSAKTKTSFAPVNGVLK